MPKQAETTKEAMWSLIKNHINCSPLGLTEIKDITTKDIQEFLINELFHGKKTKLKNLDLSGQLLSHHTIIKLRQLLIATFKKAVQENIILHNVAENTEALSTPWHESPVFSPENQKKFLAAAINHRFYVAYVLLFYLGCRRSEILGLSWDSIDLRKNILTIRQVLIIEHGEIVIRQRAKNRNSIRTIPFPKEIKYLLIEWRKRQKEESKQPGYNNKYNLVFCNKNGSPHNPAYFSRNFKSLIKKLDFCSNELHLHSTRHTWATNMVQLGIGIADIQALGGWSRPDTLLNIYAHTVKESQRKAMKKLFKELQ